MQSAYDISITLSLSPTGGLSGTLTGTTSSGSVTFTGLRILSAGSFSVVASFETMSSVSTSPLTIQNFLYSIEIACGSDTQTVVFPFTVTVTLKGEDDEVFIGTDTVTLTESGGSAIIGTASMSAVSGIASFLIYFTTSGLKTIVATCNSFSVNLLLTLVEAKLKITNFTPIVKFT